MNSKGLSQNEAERLIGTKVPVYVWHMSHIIGYLTEKKRIVVKAGERTHTDVHFRFLSTDEAHEVFAPAQDFRRIKKGVPRV